MCVLLCTAVKCRCRAAPYDHEWASSCMQRCPGALHVAQYNSVPSALEQFCIPGLLCSRNAQSTTVTYTGGYAHTISPSLTSSGCHRFPTDPPCLYLCLCRCHTLYTYIVALRIVAFHFDLSLGQEAQASSCLPTKWPVPPSLPQPRPRASRKSQVASRKPRSRPPPTAPTTVAPPPCLCCARKAVGICEFPL